MEPEEANEFRVELWKDERWPDYGLSIVEKGQEDESDIFISRKFYDEWLKVNKLYDAMQTKLKALKAGKGEG